MHIRKMLSKDYDCVYNLWLKIHHTAVTFSERGKGIGSSLVKYALNALKEEGINKVALVTFSNNEIGNAFWEKCGFTARSDLIYRNKNINNLIQIKPFS